MLWTLNFEDVKLIIANKNQLKVDRGQQWIDQRMKVLMSPFYKSRKSRNTAEIWRNKK
jgi:hypothetical protein